MNRYVVEFRNGSFFRGPKSDHGGTLGEAMRFNQAKHASQYIDKRAHWAWFNGAMVCTVESRLALINRLPKAFR